MTSHIETGVSGACTLGLVAGAAWCAARYRARQVPAWFRWLRATGRLGDVVDTAAAVTWGLMASGLLGLLVLTASRGGAR